MVKDDPDSEYISFEAATTNSYMQGSRVGWLRWARPRGATTDDWFCSSQAHLYKVCRSVWAVNASDGCIEQSLNDAFHDICARKIVFLVGSICLHLSGVTTTWSSKSVEVMTRVVRTVAKGTQGVLCTATLRRMGSGTWQGWSLMARAVAGLGRQESMSGSPITFLG